MSGHDCQNSRKRRKLNSGDDDDAVGVDEEEEEEEVDCFADADGIAQLCYEEYSKLGKSGKPTDKQAEHTVLACIIECELQQQQQQQHQRRVVALATGTKCFPGNVEYRRDEVVDCHAESLLKRAFKCYLLQLVDDCLGKKGRTDTTHQLLLRGILSRRRYCLFVSQTPCGVVSRWKGDHQAGDLESSSGALRGAFFKAVGVNRKPGRGELCPKAACIHKLAKWAIFGLQGRLLLPLIGRPLTVQKVILGNCELTKGEFPREEILARMTIDPEELHSITAQLCHPPLFNLLSPSSVVPEVAFAAHFRYEEFLREEEGEGKKRKRPCGSSIAAWQLKTLHLDGPASPLHCEVLAAGRKLGAGRRRRPQQQLNNRGQQPGKELSGEPPVEKPRPTDTEDAEVIDGERSTTTTTTTAEASTTTESAAAGGGHHRPADLAVSDSGLAERVASLLPLLLQCCSGALRDETGGDTAAVDGAEDDDFSEDFKEQRGKRGAATDGAATDSKSAKCRLGALGESAAAATTALDLDSNQLMAAYEHNWRLLQRCASIFSGWPAAQH